MSPGRILCVDDDAQVRTFTARVLGSAGQEARGQLAERQFAGMLCDINLPGESGLELLRDVRLSHPEVATVMVTGRDEAELSERALYRTACVKRNALTLMARERGAAFDPAVVDAFLGSRDA